MNHNKRRFQASLDTQHDPASMTETPLDKLTASREYVQLFWRAYLGAIPFALWETLSVFQLNKPADQPWPTIKFLVSLLGPGVSRHTILGRPKSKSHPGQQGSLDLLSSERLIYYWTEGDFPATRRYLFRVHTALPLLTPSQVTEMVTRGDDYDVDLQALHSDYLSRAGVESYFWRQVRRRSFVKLLG